MGCSDTSIGGVGLNDCIMVVTPDCTMVAGPPVSIARLELPVGPTLDRLVANQDKTFAVPSQSVDCLLLNTHVSLAFRTAGQLELQF